MKKIFNVCKLLALVLILLVSMQIMNAQNKEEKSSLSFSGYVKTDFYYDSRQMETLREGHISIYPKPMLKDVNGKDINSAPSMNMQAIQTRIRSDFKTPGIFNASVSGAVEMEFFGVSNTDVNGMRLRHAFGKLNWKHAELLVGQTWHPFFLPECSANTQSFNTGIPFQPFARNPQVRYSYMAGNFKILGAIMSERDYTSNGPKGASNEYQRNSGIPMSSLQIQLAADSGRFLAGAGLEYKQIRPELATTANVYTNEQVKALSWMAFIKYETKAYYCKIHASLLENSYDFVGIGGYASKSYDSLTKVNKYVPLQTANIWTDLQYNLKSFKLGIFMGYSKNLGADQSILVSSITSRDKTMDDIYRISPRIVYTQNKFTIGLEEEYTAASFGTPDTKGLVHHTNQVSNFRTLLTFYYFFNQ